MLSQDEKTLIFTIASKRCEDFFLEWLVSLRTLGNYHGEVMALDYGISDRTRMLVTKLGAQLYRCQMPTVERTIVDYRFIDMLPILEQHYRQYKLAHFDADIWFMSEVSELFQEVDEVPGCLYAIECRPSLAKAKRWPLDPQAVEPNAAKVEQVIKHCKGHINGGFVAGRYQPFVDKLVTMRNALVNEWKIGMVNQYLLNVLFDLDRDRANGNRWNCSMREAIREDGQFYHLKNSEMSFHNGRWMLDKIHIERVVGLHLNTAGTKTERFRKFHPRLFHRTIFDIEKNSRLRGGMDLQNKNVWDLSLEEIEYVYRHRHMNHYVYATLKTYHTSSPPLHRSVSLRTNTIPPYLRGPCEKLLQFSPWIGTRNPSFVRAGITYNTYLLYSALNQVQLEHISLVTQLLAAYAYLAIISDKNDDVPLWHYQVVRAKSPYVDAIIEKLLEPVVDIEAVIMMPMSAKDNERKRVRETIVNRNYRFVPKAVTSLIILMENGANPKRIARALLQTERAMRKYEQYEGHDTWTPTERYRTQIRYRNTLYLYGGMFFEKQQMVERARDWYLKDINNPGLLLDRSNGFFLTDMKTTERLISAYPLTTEKETQSNLTNLIHGYLVRCAREAAVHSRSIFDFLKSHRSTDLRDLFLFSGDKRMLYAGEASREVYFLSLLYNKCVLGTDYQNIDYARFFQY